MYAPIFTNVPDPLIEIELSTGTVKVPESLLDSALAAYALAGCLRIQTDPKYAEEQYAKGVPMEPLLFTYHDDGKRS